MFKNALISVSEKTGLDSFLKNFKDEDLRIVSSGGTAGYLQEKGFKVVKVSEQTQFPEVMDGRVKTLHPFIHIPLLQRAEVDEDREILKQYDLQAFDLVVVNLYPFKQGLTKDIDPQEMIELIDIGGPTLLRAAAKNFKSVTVICDPQDYSWIGEKRKTSLQERQQLAAKVFSHIQDYDRSIADYLNRISHTVGDGSYPLVDSQEDFGVSPKSSSEDKSPLETNIYRKRELDESSSFTIQGQLHKTLRYGENPQQKARWYQYGSHGLHRAEMIQGKPLSYNNILDMESAIQALRLFNDRAAVVSVKHNNPCGVGEGGNIQEALDFSLSADPVSIFGGIVALNCEINTHCARELTRIFLEAVVAPGISDEAREVLAKKKNLRVLLWKDMLKSNFQKGPQFRSLEGGFLTQSEDQVSASVSQWETVSGELKKQDKLGLSFAWRVCASLKSNAIAVTSTNQSLGLGMGQVNRVDAVNQAFERASRFHPHEESLYLASDAFFPFPDSVELAVKNGAKAIVQPGGSIKDNEVIAKARELNVSMAFTGQRHFRH